MLPTLLAVLPLARVRQAGTEVPAPHQTTMQAGMAPALATTEPSIWVRVEPELQFRRTS